MERKIISPQPQILKILKILESLSKTRPHHMIFESEFGDILICSSLETVLNKLNFESQGNPYFRLLLKLVCTGAYTKQMAIEDFLSLLNRIYTDLRMAERRTDINFELFERILDNFCSEQCGVIGRKEMLECVISEDLAGDLKEKMIEILGDVNFKNTHVEILRLNRRNMPIISAYDSYLIKLNKTQAHKSQISQLEKFCIISSTIDSHTAAFTKPLQSIPQTSLQDSLLALGVTTVILDNVDASDYSLIPNVYACCDPEYLKDFIHHSSNSSQKSHKLLQLDPHETGDLTPFIMHASICVVGPSTVAGGADQKGLVPTSSKSDYLAIALKDQPVKTVVVNEIISCVSDNIINSVHKAIRCFSSCEAQAVDLARFSEFLADIDIFNTTLCSQNSKLSQSDEPSGPDLRRNLYLTQIFKIISRYFGARVLSLGQIVTQDEGPVWVPEHIFKEFFRNLIKTCMCLNRLS
ncbi:unnamed protein product [Moneuplotes crassus]|uniref:Uncharacterized protein n=1 Tax=Euplotes crassus TaxID=5936 RepID=A0AAD1U6J0_EUPCR|nr:unnamed protein product [Moneuplotes crassus]